MIGAGDLKKLKIWLHKRKGVNIPVMHSQQEFELVAGFVKDTRIDVIINIGSWYAGLESAWNELTDAEIYGFDREQSGRKIVRNLMTEKVAMIEHDVLKRPSKLIERIMDTEDTVFLYCDGGNKIKEIEFYSPMLGKGDYLGTHDWGVNKDKYFKGKLEDFTEIGSAGATRIWQKS
jgi:hypothetical protein